MQILYLILTILIVLTAALSAQRAYQNRYNIPAYRRWRDRFRKKKPDLPTTRMFVAVRRRKDWKSYFSSLEHTEYEAAISRTVDQVRELVKDWGKLVIFESGFQGAPYGLPSNSDEDWLLFALFIVEDYNAYKNCLRILEGEKFFYLRNQCDIRLLYGEQMDDLSATIERLF